MTQATGNGGHVDGGVTTADDHNAAGDGFQAAFVEGSQEGHTGDAVGGIGARDRQGPAGLCAHGAQNGVELFLDLVEFDVFTDLVPVLTSTPISTMRLISPSRTSRGVR